MKNNAFTKDQLKKWEEYDQTFSDPVESEGVEGFKDLEKDNAIGACWSVASFGGVEHERVGNGEVTDPSTCGKPKKNPMGCLNVDLHSHVSLDGVNHSGKVALKKVFMSCDKPSCPTCFKRGWANREAVNASKIIEKISRGYIDAKKKKHQGLGLAEHLVTSVPKSDYSLPFRMIKARAQKNMFKRGIIGGVTIFHLYRYHSWEEARKKNVVFGWFESPHFHTVGFIAKGYGKCRGCPNTYEGFYGERCIIKTEKCLACEDFEGVTRRFFVKECEAHAKKMKIDNDGKSGGWIVKVMGKRKSIQATLWYQLNHCTFVRGSCRAHVVTWPSDPPLYKRIYTVFNSFFFFCTR